MLLIIFITLILSSCTGENGGTLPAENNFQAGNITLYFYYTPQCHYCKIVKPYIEFLSVEMQDIKFDFCNLMEEESCSESALNVREKVGITGVPTAVLEVNGSLSKYAGWKKVCEIGKSLENLGVELPVIRCDNKNFSVQECVDCHKNKEKTPPSNFDCSKCPEI